MDPALLLQGLVLGFTIAVTVGPISLLCIRRTLAEGQTVGLVSGLGRSWRSSSAWVSPAGTSPAPPA